MAYNGTEGAIIPRTEARASMFNYKNSAAFTANNGTEAILYGRDHIEELLLQPNCKGIRIYYGRSGPLASDAPQMILVGYDEDGNDLADKILDSGFPCPSHCSSADKKI